MNNEKSRAEQEQQGEADARNGGYPDPNWGQYYQNAYNNYKAAHKSNEKSRAEQEQQAEADARNGGYPDPNGGQYYQNAYSNYKAQNQPPK